LEAGRFELLLMFVIRKGKSEDHGRRRTMSLKLTRIEEANTAGIFVTMLKELRNYKNAEDRE
jgi:hypothetical protein